MPPDESGTSADEYQMSRDESGAQTDKLQALRDESGVPADELCAPRDRSVDPPDESGAPRDEFDTGADEHEGPGDEPNASLLGKNASPDQIARPADRPGRPKACKRGWAIRVCKSAPMLGAAQKKPA